jgi:RNA polymerase sigma-70 factor (ECF subfamily)
VPTGFDFPAPLKYIGSIESAAMGNPEFDYDVLVRPLEPRMMRSIWRIVRERQGAEDALQDALTVIWKKRETVARHPNPRALILRIAVTAAWDVLRKNRRRLRHEVPGAPEERADDSAVPVSKEEEDRNLRAAILQAIGRLPKRQAEAVLLHVVEGQSYAEIAGAMDRSEATVRIHVMRGKAALVRRLAGLRPGSETKPERNGRETLS